MIQYIKTIARVLIAASASALASVLVISAKMIFYEFNGVESGGVIIETFFTLFWIWSMGKAFQLTNRRLKKTKLFGKRDSDQDFVDSPAV